MYYQNVIAFWISQGSHDSSNNNAIDPFTVIPELTRHALTIVQRDPRVNSGLAICVYSLTVYHE